MPKFDAASLGVTPSAAPPPTTGGGKFGGAALGLPNTPQQPASPYVGLANNYAAQLSARNVLKTAATVKPADRTKYLDNLVKQLAPSKNAQERGQLKNDLSKSLGWSAGAAPAAEPSPFRGLVGDTDPAVYASAIEKQRKGQPLTPDESKAVTAMKASQKAMTNMGIALQPFLALSDISKGLVQGVKSGAGGAVQRGFNAAGGHLTYGAAEYLPGLTGARARGVTGEEILKGTKYEGNAKAALAIEVFADPSILLMGAGAVVKGGATAARLASLEKIAKTPEGAALIRDALKLADTRGNLLLKASDEITGVPAVARGVAKGPVGQAVKSGVSKLADTTLPAPLQKLTGVRTYGDAFLTPDQKAATYTAEQLARDEFRMGSKLAADDLRSGITKAVNPDARIVADLTKGLGKTDAQEAVRLLGVFTNATDPKVAEAALTKLTALGTRVGKDLEAPFVAAVKATDRIGQVTIGENLKAQALPVILDPAVTAKIQAAEKGTDLLPLVGQYKNEAGRPRGILMTQYTGRGNPDKVIAQIAAGPEIPAQAAVDVPDAARTLTASVEGVTVPRKPIEPVGIAPKAQAPVNPAGVAERIAADPVTATPPFVQGAARQTAPELRPPRAVLEDLFNGGPAARDIPTPKAAPAAINEVAPATFTPPTPTSVLDNVLTGRVEPVPTPAVAVVEAAPPPVAAVPKQVDLSGMGGAMADNLHDMLYTKYLAGDTTELGKPSNILLGAARTKAAGVDLTREQFPDFANGFLRQLEATRGAPDRQAVLGTWLDNYRPPASTVPATPTPAVVSQSGTVPEMIPREYDYTFTLKGEEIGKEGTKIYHGTKAGFESPLSLEPFEYASPANLLGTGFYVTDNPNLGVLYGIGKGKGEPGYIHSLEVARDLKLINFDQPLPPAVLQIFEDAAEEFGSLSRNAAELPGTKVFQQLKAAMREDGSLTGSEALEIYESLNDAMRAAGYDGIAHKGGQFVGGGGDHNVAVLFGGMGDGLGGLSKDLRHLGRDRVVVPAPKVTPTAPRISTERPTKTPASVLDNLINPAPATDPLIALPAAKFAPTPQPEVRAMAFPTQTPEKLVERSIPTTYRTVEVDANGLDWGALRETGARQSVINSIEGAGNARFANDATGALRIDRSKLTVPLDHPVISRYFTNQELEAARYPGSDYGERVITRRERVPDWYNPRDTAPMEVQRGLREQAQREANDAAFPNDYEGKFRDDAPFDHLAPWVIGNEYASFERLNPAKLSTRAAMNEYAQRVIAIAGRPATKGEVFAYRMALSRYQQASNLRNLNATDAAQHMADFVRLNPEATLAEVAASVARQFNLGTPGKNFIRQEMARAESGWTRQMSKTERLEFAQGIKLRDSMRGQPAPGGMLMSRLIRQPEEISAEFRQVFPQEENALKILDEQVRTRSAAIVRAQVFREYHDQLRSTAQHLTAQELQQLRKMPITQLSPEKRLLRESIARANEQGGVPAGWKIMDRSVGPFNKGDALPWWAYHDLFGASSVDDAAVSASILKRGGVSETYDRAWRSMNAQMLGSFTSVVNDQVGQFLQMALWGVTPDAVIEGLIRRATATPEQLQIMRASGIQGTTLESSVNADRMELTRLAARLDGDTDLTRTQRVVDTILRFRERGTGLDRTAMTGLSGAAADVAHLGSGYVFRARSALSDLQREALYFHRLQLGDTPKQAAAFTNQTMMDMRLVPAYARVVGKVWPFFNWIAMSGPRSVITVLKKPAINSAYQRFASQTDSGSPEDQARRVLARDGGWFNLGVDERNGTRIYLDPRSWDPTATIPQLLDFSGTKIGVVSLPWWFTLMNGLQNGTDRFGGNIYSTVLDGQRGGWAEAYRIDKRGASLAAARHIYQQFAPTYAPGTSRARAFVSSILETAKLPQDGSKDIAIAHSLAGTPQGRAFLLYMQNGNLAVVDQELIGNRESPYSEAPPSVARAAGSLLLPLRGVNADQNVQGTALSQLSVGLLNLQSFKAGEIKKLAQLEAGGASPAELRVAEARAEREYTKRAARLETLDRATR